MSSGSLVLLRAPATVLYFSNVRVRADAHLLPDGPSTWASTDLDSVILCINLGCRTLSVGPDEVNKIVEIPGGRVVLNEQVTTMTAMSAETDATAVRVVLDGVLDQRVGTAHGSVRR
jgi:hypothetical protein